MKKIVTLLLTLCVFSCENEKSKELGKIIEEIEKEEKVQIDFVDNGSKDFPSINLKIDSNSTWNSMLQSRIALQSLQKFKRSGIKYTTIDVEIV